MPIVLQKNSTFRCVETRWTAKLILLNIIINKTLWVILITLLYEYQVKLLFADFSNAVIPAIIYRIADV